MYIIMLAFAEKERRFLSKYLTARPPLIILDDFGTKQRCSRDSKLPIVPIESFTYFFDLLIEYRGTEVHNIYYGSAVWATPFFLNECRWSDTCSLISD